MGVNVYTKNDSSYDYSDVDLCADLPINPEVKNIYYKYQQRCNPFLFGNGILNRLQQQYDIAAKRDYYVYAWYVVGSTPKYFYVGKGRNSRYRHILKEIKEYEEREKNSPRFAKYEKFAILSKMGIDCEFLIKGLTEYEALIFEQCSKLRLIDRGDVLLCVEGIDVSNLPDGWVRYEYPGMPPTIQNSPFRRRYFNDLDLPSFDPVSISGLTAIWFYPFFLVETPTTQNNRELIEHVVSKQFGGKVLLSRPTKNRTVILQGFMFEDTYRKLKEGNNLVYSDLEVLSFLYNNGFLHHLD